MHSFRRRLLQNVFTGVAFSALGAAAVWAGVSPTDLAAGAQSAGPRPGPHAGERGDDSALTSENFQARSRNLERYSAACKMSVLKKLGWSIDTDTRATTAVAHAGEVCEAHSTAEIESGNLLSLTLPGQGPLTAHISAALDGALLDTPSVCAYKQVYNAALTRATAALYDNHLYSFNTFFGSGIVRLQDVKGWERVDCADHEKCFSPATGQIAGSLEALYHASLASECGTGLQLAEYSTLRELFGDQEVERRFAPENIMVGDWADVNQSNSVIHGKVGRRVFSQTGIDYAQEGSRMLVGVPGYIGSLYDEKHLDDPTNRNENFIIVDATAAAAQALVARGGLVKVMAYLKQIWQLTRQVTPAELQGLQWMAHRGTLNGATLHSLRMNIPSQDPSVPSAVALQLAQLLSDPFLNETKVYVHPIGVEPISWHILRLARVNPRTPYGISFYAEATHGEIFDRWLQMQLDTCAN